MERNTSNELDIGHVYGLKHTQEKKNEIISKEIYKMFIFI